MATAEKNFSPQLNKLFAESLYEVGWLEKQAGETRAALEITSPAEKAAKSKAFARSRIEQAQQAEQQGRLCDRAQVCRRGRCRRPESTGDS